jgi:hypothetical protein
MRIDANCRWVRVHRSLCTCRRQAAIDGGDDKLSKLEAQWNEHKSDKVRQLDALKTAIKTLQVSQTIGRIHTPAVQMSESRCIQVDMAEMTSKCAQLSDELHVKQTYREQLVGCCCLIKITIIRLQEIESKRLQKCTPRSAYTRRILEIVASIRKQRLEIDRVGHTFNLHAHYSARSC